MPWTRNDVWRLVGFSLKYRIDLACTAFPMFSRTQIESVYRMSVANRSSLLSVCGSDESVPSTVRPFNDHRDPSQSAKMREQATDPSNR
jgi:hypothetical protein